MVEASTPMARVANHTLVMRVVRNSPDDRILLCASRRPAPVTFRAKKGNKGKTVLSATKNRARTQ